MEHGMLRETTEPKYPKKESLIMAFLIANEIQASDEHSSLFNATKYNLDKGAYLVRLTNNGHPAFEKVMKMR